MSLILTANYIVKYKTTVKNLELLSDYEFDNRYVCDTKGNVYLIARTTKYTYMLKPMRPFITRDGYVEYVLTDSLGVKKHIQAHRIVALLYIKNTNRYKKYVNHKDGDRKNNDMSNLEWVTASENIKHSFDKLNKVVWNKGKKVGSNNI